MSARDPLRVAFLFASQGVGGAESSMIRLITYAHPAKLDCLVVHLGRENAAFTRAFSALEAPFHQLGSTSLVSLARLLRRTRPDVCYAFGQIRTVGWALAARLAGVPIVVGAERGSGTRWINRLGRSFDHVVLDGYIANSEHSALKVRQLVRGRRRVFVVCNGIDLDVPPRSDDEPGAGDSARGPRIVCVANIRPNKGHLTLFEAVRLLRRKYPTISATLLGADMTDGAVFDEAQQRGLSDTYEWLGFVSDVAAHVREHDVLVLPTLHREGIPTCLIEAMFVGVPVVASNVGGVSEVVIDGETGTLVEPGDSDALARAISTTLEDGDNTRRIVRRAREHVLRRHTMDAMLQGHVSAFETLLSRPRAHGAAARPRYGERDAR